MNIRISLRHLCGFRAGAAAILLTGLLCLAAVTSQAQDFSLDPPNAAMLPTVSLSVHMKGTETIDKKMVKLSENGKPVTDFSVEAATTDGTENDTAASPPPAGSPGAVCYLLETSAFTTAAQLERAKQALAAALRKNNGAQPANICYYSRTRGSGAINRVSSEFTTDYEALIRDMNGRVAWTPEEKPQVDLYKAVHECMEFMAGKPNLPSGKSVVIIATGNNNGTSPFSLRECEDYAAKNSIVVNSIGQRSRNVNAADNIKLLAEKTGGQYRAAATAPEMESAISAFSGAAPAPANDAPTPATAGNDFTIRYSSSAENNEESTVIVTIGSSTQQAVFTPGAVAQSAATPKKKRYTLLWASIAAAIIAAVAAAVAITGKKKKAAAEAQEQQRQAEQAKQQLLAKAAAEKQQAAEAENKRLQQELQDQKSAPTLLQQPASPPPDPYKTVVSGLRLPSLSVSFGGTSQSYPLSRGSYTIGRNPNNDITIGNNTVSGNHARLDLENGQWYLTDTGSKNGTWLNGARISKVALAAGSRLQLGEVVCTFEL